jgi:DNA-binding Lrp family transcriptional regulator
MLYKLDLKSRKLLYELDTDARQSYNKLAKKVGLSKNAVIYRIKKLRKAGIIKLFHTVVDTGKLGYIGFRLYLRLRNTTPEKEQEIINFMKSKEIVAWLVSIDGEYNLGSLILAKSVREMNELWKELLEKYVNYIDKRLLTIMTKVRYFSRAYITGLKTNTYEINFATEPERAKLDRTDFEILRMMAPDARIKTVDIASKLKLSPRTVTGRIRQLEKNKIITAYKVMFDIEKLGYQYFKILFRLHNVTREKENKLRGYIKSHPNIIYDDRVLGGDDIEIEVQVRNSAELRKIVDEIKSLFSDIIKDYKTMEFYREHKFLLLPAKDLSSHVRPL